MPNSWPTLHCARKKVFCIESFEKWSYSQCFNQKTLLNTLANDVYPVMTNNSLKTIHSQRLTVCWRTENVLFVEFSHIRKVAYPWIEHILFVLNVKMWSDYYLYYWQHEIDADKVSSTKCLLKWGDPGKCVYVVRSTYRWIITINLYKKKKHHFCRERKSVWSLCDYDNNDERKKMMKCVSNRHS